MSKDGKRKWEIDYEKYKTMNLDEEIKKLESQVNASRRELASIKDSNSQDYKAKSSAQRANEKEINRLNMLKINMPKVANILKTKDAYKAKLEKLMKDKKSVEETKTLGNEAKKLEEELDKLKKDEEKLKDALKDKRISPENREKLNKALSDNSRKQNENQLKFSANQLKLTEKLNSPLAKKDFDKEIQTTRNMISKCNFIGKNLMEGKRMEEITADLKNWKDRKFTDKTKEANDKKETSKSEKTEPEKAETKPEKPRTEKDQKDTLENDKIEEIEKAVDEAIKEEDSADKPVKVSEWDQKHPRLAKIKNFFKDAGNKGKEILGKASDKVKKLFNREEKEEEKKEEEKKTEPKAESRTGKLSAQEIADKKSKFYERLTETGKYSDLPQNSKLTEALGKAPNPRETGEGEER